MMRNLISIVLPVYNEEEGIVKTIEVLENFIEKQPQDFELLFIDDGSVDSSVALIKSMQKKFLNIKLIEFSRNFGHQLAISAGIRYTMGDAVVVMDADLQDPPSVIPAMIKEWKNGAQVVYGKRKSREGEGGPRRALHPHRRVRAGAAGAAGEPRRAARPDWLQNQP